jgi:hypothetical protein
LVEEALDLLPFLLLGLAGVHPGALVDTSTDAMRA